MSNLVTASALNAALEKHRKEKQVDFLESESPHVLVVGPSGTGKSRSIINLPPENTIIFNPEGKVLPFENSTKFKDRKLSGFSTFSEIDTFFKIAAADPTIKYIVYDSFTEYLELLIRESRMINKNYDIYNFYNAQIGSFLLTLRKIKNKIVILTGLDALEKIEQPSGALISKRFFDVEGKIWRAKIESKFSIVLYTHVQQEPGSNPPKMKYQFATQTDGITSAKSPEGLFPSYYINNDLKEVVDRVEKYFGLAQGA
jgi:hypothetical protein